MFLASSLTAVAEEGLRLLGPVESIGYDDAWGSSALRVLPAGGHALAVLERTGDRCTLPRVDGAAPEFLVFVPTEITTPSSEKGHTGVHYDLLVPFNQQTCSLSPYLLAEWQVWSDQLVILSDETGSVAVEVRIGPDRHAPERPFLVGATSSYIMLGHCDPACPEEVELAKAYGDLLARHLIQPIQSWIRFPDIVDGRLDLDRGGEASFRARVMDHAAGGLVGFPRARWYPDPRAYLEALERTVIEEGLVGRAWVYAADEPSDIDALAAELQAYRDLAPSVRVMVTTTLDARLDGLVDIYAPVLNWLGRAGKPDAAAYEGLSLWSYVSCMGSCGPNRAGDPDAGRVPGPDTGLPDMLIDRPAQRLFAFFEELDAIGADAGLYYMAVEAHRLVPLGIDPINDPWNFGGNGDGVLLYPGRAGTYGLDNDQPLASWRLKLIRHAIETLW